jgi:hypothetical protein
MRRVLICTGVLGGGTALTFAAAALAATLLPGGTVVPSSGSMFVSGGFVKGGPVIAPAPIQRVVVDDGSAGPGASIDIGLTPEPVPSN